MIWGYKTEILTDHKPLSVLFHKSIPDGVLGRWALLAQEFDLSLKYIKGKDNTLADVLSRLGSSTVSRDELLVQDDDFIVDFVATTRLDKDSSQNNLIEAQKADELCNKIKKVIEGDNDSQDNIKDIHKFFVMNDTLFYRKTLERMGTQEEVVTFVVPESWEEKVIIQVHESNNNAHMDKERTIFRINKKFHFLSAFSKKVDQILRSCHICNKFKNKIHKPVERRNYPLPDQPFRRVAMDFLDPLPETESGNEYFFNIRLLNPLQRNVCNTK